jgi:predicted ribosome quality control (RQC) complex YloA/Tae2 family protein
MEGLLIAEVLRKLEPSLPSVRQSWRFPDSHTFVLPLTQGALWFYLKPPHTQLAYRDDYPEASGPKSGFQALLAARATGRLERADQRKLDRVAFFDFAEAEGFVVTPAVTLVAELTGRNGNLILLQEGTIVGAMREVGAGVNRFRQVRPGLAYTPPPPYDKLDPRYVPPEGLREALAGKRLAQLRKLVDGIGPELTRTLAALSEVTPEEVLQGERLERVVSGLKCLAAEPGRALEEAGALPDVAALRERERVEGKRAALCAVLEKRLAIVHRRLDDIAKTREAAVEATDLRRKAELLLAYQHQVTAGAECVELTGFDGEPVTLVLEPRKSAVENAQALFDKARKRERRAAQADERERALEAERRELEKSLARLGTLDEAALEAMHADLVPESEAQRTQPGARFTSPQGFEVLVGRNARENDLITFKLAKSRDVWLHAQGYPGSHVVVRAGNREVPFETILFAAQLAAAYSKAGQSDNVPVDYTLRKYVWRPKGAPAGAVHFTQQKTVYVMPSRRPEASAG